MSYLKRVCRLVHQPHNGGMTKEHRVAIHFATQELRYLFRGRWLKLNSHVV